ncbi:unnamed protein product [Brachionus calyciflorus]|uniref:DZANK-type domain-containing protein n=1 Tax=Brachionus calyciflorus TaxID=104777 RepID=A0A814FR35_9BILA|nr:unnamed protein product [Brachionus calyciflorus]
MVTNCSFCQAQVKDNFKFCGVCGKALVKNCLKCNLEYGPSFNFCGQCGSSLNSDDVIKTKKTRTKTLDALNQNTGHKTKVGILFGSDLTAIKQEHGGGSRRVILNETDNYKTILRKIGELYFPWNQYTCLGEINEFRIISKNMNVVNDHALTGSRISSSQLVPSISPPSTAFNKESNKTIEPGNKTLSKRVRSSSESSSSSSSSSSTTCQSKTAAKNLNVCIKTEKQTPKPINVKNSNNLQKTSSSSSSSLDSDSDRIVKPKKTAQNLVYESLRTKNKILNPMPESSKKSLKPRSTSSSSSSSSFSSSSSTASFKEAKKLDKKLNKRIKELKDNKLDKNKTDSKKLIIPNEKKTIDGNKTLLPTPNFTPSLKANLPSDTKEKNIVIKTESVNANDKGEDVIILNDKSTKKIEEIVLDSSDKNDDYDKRNDYSNNYTERYNNRYTYRNYSSRYYDANSSYKDSNGYYRNGSSSSYQHSNGYYNKYGYNSYYKSKYYDDNYTNKYSKNYDYRQTDTNRDRKA